MRFLGLAVVSTTPSSDLAAALDRCWSDLEGDLIPAASKARVIRASGFYAFHYGECLYDGGRAIFDALGLYDAPGAVFADLGSGCGKLVAQAYCETPVAAAVGVELARERHDKALRGWRRLCDERHIEDPTVSFVCDDMFSVDLDAVTHCYVSNLLFDAMANRALAALFDGLPNLRRVATLERLDRMPKRFTLTMSSAAMTWNRKKASPIYVYSCD